MTAPLFPLGQVVATPAALAVMERFGIDAMSLLGRHVTGDWGDLDDEDRAQNERSLRNGALLLSAYGDARDGSRMWVITDGIADNGERLATTILLPEEY